MFRQQMVILFISVLRVEHKKTETVIDGGRGVQVRKSPTRNLPSQRGINAGFVFLERHRILHNGSFNIYLHRMEYDLIDEPNIKSLFRNFAACIPHLFTEIRCLK